jgi:putative transposase
LSNARDAEACAEALKKALAKMRHTRDIHHGSRQPVHQWLLDRRVDVSTDAKVKNSIGGKGRWIDNRVIDNRKLGNHRVGNRRI